MLEDGFEHVPGVPVEVVATVGQDDALGCVSLQLKQVRLQPLRAVVELVAVLDIVAEVDVSVAS